MTPETGNKKRAKLSTKLKNICKQHVTTYNIVTFVRGKAMEKHFTVNNIKQETVRYKTTISHKECS